MKNYRRFYRFVLALAKNWRVEVVYQILYVRGGLGIRLTSYWIKLISSV